MRDLIIKIFDYFGLLSFAVNIYKKIIYLTNFKLQVQNTKFNNKGAPDSLPLPPPHLTFLVTGNYDVEAFYQNGILGAKCIRNVLEKNRLDIASFKSILDYGCGCGRVIRNWKTLKGAKLYGTDYNPLLVDWCQKALGFAEFKTNKLSEKLSYEDNTFDFIYAISVFTHLSEKLQGFWINELKRILKPGAYLYLTVHGTSCLNQLTLEEKERFKLGELVVKYEASAGTNICGVFHPEQYVRESLAKEFSIVDFIPCGAKDAAQDVYLLRRGG